MSTVYQFLLVEAIVLCHRTPRFWQNRAMFFRGFLLLIACAFFVSCTSPNPVAVTPTGSGSVTPLPAPALVTKTSVDDPRHIGFEAIALEGELEILTDFKFLPDSDDFLALNRFGKVGWYRLEGNRAMPQGFFKIPAVFTGGGCAANSLALDPGFKQNKMFYVSYCLDGHYNVIKRYTMSTDDFAETLYSVASVLVAGDPKAEGAQNAIGTILFGPDGALWVNMGERKRDVNSQDFSNALGKVSRIKPITNPSMGGYQEVAGNAFSDSATLNGLIYAYGLRNPWRGVFDSKGRYWVSDVGATEYEEINVIVKPGQNFGWPTSEGPLCRTGSCASFVAPIRYWDRSPTHPFIAADPLVKNDSYFRTAWVGIEYRPAANDPYKGLLTGKMLYGDFFLGYVRGIELGEGGEIVSDQYLGHLDLPVAWQQGRDGYLYAATMFESFDKTREAEGDSNLLPQAEQGGLWRVIPLP